MCPSTLPLTSQDGEREVIFSMIQQNILIVWQRDFCFNCFIVQNSNNNSFSIFKADVNCFCQTRKLLFQRFLVGMCFLSQQLPFAVCGFYIGVKGIGLQENPVSPRRPLWTPLLSSMLRGLLPKMLISLALHYVVSQQHIKLQLRTTYCLNMD